MRPAFALAEALFPLTHRIAVATLSGPFSKPARQVVDRLCRVLSPPQMKVKAMKMTLAKYAGLAATPFILAAAINISHASASHNDKHISVFKTPWCGCCEAWVSAMRKAGFTVETTDMEDLSAIKKQAGLPDQLEACHTAVIGADRKYVIEGHVPLQAVQKLLHDLPDIRGIAVPGMPTGSLGMGDDASARYTVLSYSWKPSEPPAAFYEAGQ